MKLKVQMPAHYYAIAENMRREILEDMMSKKEAISILMLSPLYFTIPVQKRIELVKWRGERFSSPNLYEDLLKWIKTGNLNL
jgi:hypothetical protein